MVNRRERVKWSVLLLLLTAGWRLQAAPKLLLPPQRLQRLMRDRQRATPRWQALEEAAKQKHEALALALYYAVTADQSAGSEALDSLRAANLPARDRALVVSWCDSLIPSAERARLLGPQRTGADPAAEARDRLFRAAVTGEDVEAVTRQTWPALLRKLQAPEFAPEAPFLYALAEYLNASRELTGVDLRNDDTHYFADLPARYLLGLHPEETARPTAIQHMAALALVSMDPNLETAQFLQGWGMETYSAVSDGELVPEELLWANPYLPGVSFQNLEPWYYSPAGVLYARTTWDADACWISMTRAGVASSGCPATWRSQPPPFGHLRLQPVTGECVDLGKPSARTIILYGLRPGQKMTWQPTGQRKRIAVGADTAGLLHVPANVAGDVCAAE